MPHIAVETTHIGIPAVTSNQMPHSTINCHNIGMTKDDNKQKKVMIKVEFVIQ